MLNRSFEKDIIFIKGRAYLVLPFLFLTNYTLMQNLMICLVDNVVLRVGLYIHGGSINVRRV